MLSMIFLSTYFLRLIYRLFKNWTCKVCLPPENGMVHKPLIKAQPLFTMSDKAKSCCGVVPTRQTTMIFFFLNVRMIILLYSHYIGIIIWNLNELLGYSAQIHSWNAKECVSVWIDIEVFCILFILFMPGHGNRAQEVDWYCWFNSSRNVLSSGKVI